MIRKLLAILIIVVGGVFLIAPWGAALRDSNLERDGEQAVGRIIEKRAIEGGDAEGPDITYHVDFVFTTRSAQEIRGSREIRRELWEKLESGDTITIKYNPNDPRQHLPEGSYPARFGMALFSSLFGVLGIAVGALLLIAKVEDSAEHPPGE